MIMREVRVTIAPGKRDDYWAWARDIVELWDAHGVRRAGGPYRLQDDSDGQSRDVALWLTLHESMAEIEDEFRTLYSDGPGKALIEQRPPLVAETTHDYWDEWPF